MNIHDAIELYKLELREWRAAVEGTEPLFYSGLEEHFGKGENVTIPVNRAQTADEMPPEWATLLQRGSEMTEAVRILFGAATRGQLDDLLDRYQRLYGQAYHSSQQDRNNAERQRNYYQDLMDIVRGFFEWLDARYYVRGRKGEF